MYCSCKPPTYLEADGRKEAPEPTDAFILSSSNLQI
jgi:hypothetical protein